MELLELIVEAITHTWDWREETNDDDMIAAKLIELGYDPTQPVEPQL